MSVIAETVYVWKNGFLESLEENALNKIYYQ